MTNSLLLNACSFNEKNTYEKPHDYLQENITFSFSFLLADKLLLQRKKERQKSNIVGNLAFYKFQKIAIKNKLRIFLLLQQLFLSKCFYLFHPSHHSVLNYFPCFNIFGGFISRRKTGLISHLLQLFSKPNI